MSAEHIENVMEHDDSQTQSETHSTPSYSATRRTARKHKRVVRQGTELFDADGVKLEPSDVLTKRHGGDDRTVFLNPQHDGRLIGRHGEHRDGIALRILSRFAGQQRFGADRA